MASAALACFTTLCSDRERAIIILSSLRPRSSCSLHTAPPPRWRPLPLCPLRPSSPSSAWRVSTNFEGGQQGNARALWRRRPPLARAPVRGGPALARAQPGGAAPPSFECQDLWGGVAASRQLRALAGIAPIALFGGLQSGRADAGAAAPVCGARKPSRASLALCWRTSDLCPLRVDLWLFPSLRSLL